MDINMTITIINILAIIASPLIALWISNKVQNDKEKRNDKMWILKTLMVQRSSFQDMNYVNALNLIDLIFADSKKVREAYKNLYKEFEKRGDSFDSDKIKRMETKLIEEIINDIGYGKKINWVEVQEPYVPNWVVNDFKAKQTIAESQKYMANILQMMANSNIQMPPQDNKENKNDK